MKERRGLLKLANKARHAQDWIPALLILHLTLLYHLAFPIRDYIKNKTEITRSYKGVHPPWSDYITRYTRAFPASRLPPQHSLQ